MAKMTALARARKRTLTIPVRKTIGKNTIKVQIVEVRTGIATSAPPSIAARRAGRPDSSFFEMFSITTIELSTSTPIDSARPPKVIALIVWPVACRPRNAARIASGSESRMAMVERGSPRKRNTSSAARPPPIKVSSVMLPIACRMNTDWSATIVNE